MKYFIGCFVIFSFCLFISASAQTPYPMSGGNYSEDFSDIASWQNNFASGIGANRFGAITVGTYPNPTQTTVFATATFNGGVQRGSDFSNPPGSIVLLTSGTTDNSNAAAFDLFLDFTGVNAGTISLSWAEVNNQTGNRVSTFTLQTNTGTGGSFVDLPGSSISITNNVASSGTLTNIALPSGFNNNASARIRFYLRNGSGGSTGSRPKISIDNVSVTGTSSSTPNIILSTPSLPTFGNVSLGSSSSSQSFTVEGSSLTNDISITAPTGFEMRTGVNLFSTSSITLTQSGGVVPTTTIDVRFTPLTGGSFSDNVACASTGATTKFVSVNGIGVTNYYSKSTGDLDALSTWGTDSDGNGSTPSDFTTDNQIFNIRNNPAPTIEANWTVSGTNSKVILGDGSNAINFTIPSSYALSGTIDLSANSTLTLQGTTLPTFGSISPSSMVNYTQSGSYTIPATPSIYGNLILTGGTKTLSAAGYTIQGNFVIDGVTNFRGDGVFPYTTVNLAGNLTLQNSSTFDTTSGSRPTLVCNGSTLQTLQGNGSDFYFFRLNVNNLSGVILSNTGGSSNLYLGNASTGGYTLINGNLTVNSNTITFYAGNTSIGTGNGSLTVSPSSNLILNRVATSGSLGTLKLTAGSQTLNNLVVNATGVGNTLTMGSGITVAGALQVPNLSHLILVTYQTTHRLQCRSQMLRQLVPLRSALHLRNIRTLQLLESIHQRVLIATGR